MGMREKLIEILRKPIFPHELVDPTEAVADYLLDNDVVQVVRCKDCVHFNYKNGFCEVHSRILDFGNAWDVFCENDFCSYGERRNDGNND